MAAELLANNFATQLSVGCAAGDATIQVAAAAPAALQGGQFRILVDSEYMLVTGGQSGTTWNVTRGIEGSAAAQHLQGVWVTHLLTAGALFGGNLASVANVSWMGYEAPAPSGDATGVTDTAALIAADTAAAAAGLPLLLRYAPSSAPYWVNGGFAPTTDWTTLVGRSQCWVKRTSTGSRVIDLNGKTGVEVHGFSYDGNRAGTALTGPHFRMSMSDRCRFYDLFMQNTPVNDVAIELRNSTRCDADNIELDTVGYGITCGSYVGDTNNLSQRCRITRIRAANVDKNVIFITGSLASSSSPNNVWNHTVDDVIAYNFGDTAVEMGIGCINCAAYNITADGAGAGLNGILIRDNQGTIVDGFEIYNVQGGAGTGTGLNVLPLFTNNISNATVTNGTIYSCSIGATLNDCFASTFGNITISHSTTYGWQVLVVQHSTFTNCGAYKNGYHGWQIGPSGNATQATSFASCWATSNSQAVSNTYNGFDIGPSTNTLGFTACIGSDDQGASNTQAFGFNHTGNNCYFDPSCFGFGNKNAPWGGSALLGTRLSSQWFFPQPVSTSALPAAAVANRNLILIRNTSGVADADAVFISSKSQSGTYSWNQIMAAHRSAVNDVAYTAVPEDYIIAYTALTAGRTVTLPAASSVTPGWVMVIKDESGNAGTNNITVSRAGADTIDGATTKVINAAFGSLRIYCDGASGWHVI